jgi:Spy/CpxP family protein refolding chaperone
MTPATEMRPRTRTLAVLLLVGTFVIGALTGAGVLVLLGPPPPPPGGPMRGGGLGPLTALGLSDEQMTQARELRERYRPELEAIFKETRPKVRVVQEQIEGELRQLLTPEQRLRLDELQARRDREQDRH